MRNCKPIETVLYRKEKGKSNVGLSGSKDPRRKREDVKSSLFQRSQKPDVCYDVYTARYYFFSFLWL